MSDVKEYEILGRDLEITRLKKELREVQEELSLSVPLRDVIDILLILRIPAPAIANFIQRNTSRVFDSKLLASEVKASIRRVMGFSEK